MQLIRLQDVPQASLLGLWCCVGYTKARKLGKVLSLSICVETIMRYTDLMRFGHLVTDCRKGGTINGSINLPAQSLYPTIPTLYRLFEAAKVETVIWYCGKCKMIVAGHVQRLTTIA